MHRKDTKWWLSFGPPCIDVADDVNEWPIDRLSQRSHKTDGLFNNRYCTNRSIVTPRYHFDHCSSSRSS